MTTTEAEIRADERGNDGYPHLRWRPMTTPAPPVRVETDPEGSESER